MLHDDALFFAVAHLILAEIVDHIQTIKVNFFIGACQRLKKRRSDNIEKTHNTYPLLNLE